jgi:hypothetical protein
VAREMLTIGVEAAMRSLADQFVPTFDVSDSVGTIVDADVPTTWRALLETDLMEVGRQKPLVGVLGAHWHSNPVDDCWRWSPSAIPSPSWPV